MTWFEYVPLVELLVQPHQHEPQHGGGNDSEERRAAVDRHGDDIPGRHVVKIHVASVD